MSVRHVQKRPFLSTLSPKPVVGVSLSTDSIECVALSRRRGEYTLSYVGKHKLARGTVDRGEVLDGSGLIKALAPLGSRLGAQRVHIAVPCEKTTIFDVRAPINASPADINAIIEFQLERVVGEAEEMAFSYARVPFRLHSAHLPRDEEAHHTHLVVTAYPKKMCDTLIGACRSAGFARPSCFAEVHSLARAVLDPQADGTHLLLDKRDGRVSVHLVVDGVVCRSFVAEGGDQSLPESVAKHAVDTWYARGEEDALVFEPVASVVLCGAIAEAPGVREAVSSVLSVPVKRANVWKNVFSLERTIPDIDATTAQEYAVAVGLALGGA